MQTADGSNTVYNAVVGENYHSRNGALQESRHVFVNAGLHHFLHRRQARSVSVLEVGFGTGLNFLLSADYCTAQNITLDYCGIEAFPLSPKMIRETGYEQYINHDLWQQFNQQYTQSMVASTPLNTNSRLPTAGCQLQIAHCQLLQFETEKRFDIIYFDAFAVAHQPEMWNEEAIAHTVKFMKPGGVFVTYAITGNLKRMLKALGLTIYKIPGAAGKREMLRAVLEIGD